MTYNDHKHRDEPDCGCGLCEPADLGYSTLGSMLSGNPGCDFPACSYLGIGCMWGSRRCFADRELADATDG